MSKYVSDWQSTCPKAPTKGLDRRTVMLGGAAGLATAVTTVSNPLRAAAGKAGAQKPFSPATVLELARDSAKRPFQAPSAARLLAAPKLTYDEYRDVRFRPERAIWRGDERNAELQLFATGYLANTPIDIWLVENATARRLEANQLDFALGHLASAKDPKAPHALSGFRIHSPINNDDYLDEHTVFQGASYFRAVARGQCYGLSARGLALNTARPEGEEFPVFRSFWIETPKRGADNVVVHALLDSKSVTGAYRFDIRPGAETTMEVSATLFARSSLEHTGLAPLTSMYLFGPASRRINGDFRPSVHDSEGLAIYNGRGERLWRPLTNPKTLQTSVFTDENPKGFGLIQRDRDFRTYQDLEADYERRPSLWVEPMGDWGHGHVELVEIPASEEIHDNVAVYWKPKTPIQPGQPFKFAYRLRWTGPGPSPDATAKIAKTRVGTGSKKGTTRFIVDVTGPELKALAELPKAEFRSPHTKTMGNIVVQKNSRTGGLRASFEIATADIDVADMRLDLVDGKKRISETWLFRWTRS